LKSIAISLGKAGDHNIHNLHTPSSNKVKIKERLNRNSSQILSQREKKHSAEKEARPVSKRSIIMKQRIIEKLNLMPIE